MLAEAWVTRTVVRPGIHIRQRRGLVPRLEGPKQSKAFIRLASVYPVSYTQYLLLCEVAGELLPSRQAYLQSLDGLRRVSFMLLVGCS